MYDYPINLKLKNKKIVVIGGGRVAFRKVKGLLETRANIMIVSPELCNELKNFLTEDNITWIQDIFKEEYLLGATLIFAATSNREVNLKVFHTAEETQLVNMIDDQKCDFHVPAVMRRGKLAISISTSGASPSLAKKIKDELATIYDENVEEELEFLFEARKKVLRELKLEKHRKLLLKKLIDELPICKEKRQQQFEIWLQNLKSQEVDV
ncbi:precorrin-2 dehydrogenase/sirohydrochlorin ferrochelatase family protein [Bacillus sp. FJAT-45350]|uniref:precorrin-2 dehydrogenase/sirohydrochlorin ferrochelatase family protein n=1 Tax=Bacillus sp. FJAT-45350 TaxID=2011014 RepID=UPI0015CD5293|nr:bifunctional precorrin-2 dehydrogenase/sirohydrochlorin ferrochelatase [Bacillus sp. FJAT-45350]